MIPTSLAAFQHILALKSSSGVKNAMIDVSKKSQRSLKEVALQVKTITREVFLPRFRMAA
jgi:hypothetical protein